MKVMVLPTVICALGTVINWLMQGRQNTEIRRRVETIKITGWNDKTVVLKKTTLHIYFKTFIGKINSGNLIM